MSQQYKHSNVLDPAILARSRSFTTLPVRINNNDAQAQKASIQFVKDWERVAKGKQFDVNVSQSPIGHFASLALPECPPERLAFAARAFDYVTAIDDMTDLPQSLEENTQHQKAKTWGRIRAARAPDWKYTTRLEKFQGRLILEGIESCGKGLLAMLGSVRSFEASNAIYSRECTSLEDYLPLRIINMGVTQIEGAIRHTMDIDLDAKEIDSVCHVLRPLGFAMALTNDYFSYHKEKALHPLHNVSGNIFNAVPILMAQHAISEDDAFALVKRKIIEAEKEHRVELEELEQKGPLPPELKRYIAAYSLATAGFHVWQASTLRYAAWTIDGNVQHCQPIDESWFQKYKRSILRIVCIASR